MADPAPLYRRTTEACPQWVAVGCPGRACTTNYSLRCEGCNRDGSRTVFVEASPEDIAAAAGISIQGVDDE